MIAYCWRTGVIEFGQRVPSGAVEILRGKGVAFRRAVTVQARHAHDSRLLVPGVPEADSDIEAAAALRRFQARCAKAAAASFVIVGGTAS